MTRARRGLTPEYKDEAVKLVLTSGKTFVGHSLRVS